MTEPQHETGDHAQPQSGLDPHVGGLLSYLLFGWIGGLIMFLTQSHREVRFHGMQSILLSVALLVIYIGLTVISGVLAFVPFLGLLITAIAFPLVGLAGFVLWIYMCIKGYQLEHTKLPLIGNMAEQWSGYETAPA